ncbi:MAG: hypothetical protein WDN07_04150 [Actinomycetota bacterium]
MESRGSTIPKPQNPHAATAALNSHLSSIWIAGGLAKGAAMGPLIERCATRIKAAILIGQDASIIATALSKYAPTIPYFIMPFNGDAEDLMRNVVAKAQELATDGIQFYWLLHAHQWINLKIMQIAARNLPRRKRGGWDMSIKSPTRRQKYSHYLQRIDAPYYLIVGSLSLLSALGIIMVLSASSVLSLQQSGSTYSIFFRQLVFFGVSIMVLLIASHWRTSVWRGIQIFPSPLLPYPDS